MFPTVEWKDGAVVMLDQRRLPAEVVAIECRNVAAVAQAIRDLAVRGAPAIGVAAAYGVALGARASRATTAEAFAKDLEAVCAVLATSRPTAVNLFWAITRMKQAAHTHRGRPLADLQRLLLAEAKAIHEEDITQNRAIGRHGAALLSGGAQVLTYCNTGALATGGHGTALGVIRTAWAEGKRLTVYACETRPVLQGARLTMWELQQDGIPATLITDNAAGALMAQGKITHCLVGGDRVAANGDTANKIGTYTLAVLCHAHGVPFYVAAPSSSIDLALASGEAIPIEERAPTEVTQVGGVEIAPKGTQALNPAFDVTPARYITAIITERGVFAPADLIRRKK